MSVRDRLNKLERQSSGDVADRCPACGREVAAVHVVGAVLHCIQCGSVLPEAPAVPVKGYAGVSPADWDADPTTEER